MAGCNTDKHSMDDILCQLPRLNAHSTSLVTSLNDKDNNLFSPQSSTADLSSCNLPMFDDWIDYFSSKATSTSDSHGPLPFPVAQSFHQILDRFMHTQSNDGTSDIQESPPPSPSSPKTTSMSSIPGSSPSSVVPSFHEILDQFRQDGASDIHEPPPPSPLSLALSFNDDRDDKSGNCTLS